MNAEPERCDARYPARSVHYQFPTFHFPLRYRFDDYDTDRG